MMWPGAKESIMVNMPGPYLPDPCGKRPMGSCHRDKMTIIDREGTKSRLGKVVVKGGVVAGEISTLTRTTETRQRDLRAATWQGRSKFPSCHHCRERGIHSDRQVWSYALENLLVQRRKFNLSRWSIL
jgi:hypothetical protein